MARKHDWLARVRRDAVGRDAAIRTPFGTRLITYADYTASGRALQSVEDYIERLLPIYANTHTEDTATGRTMTGLLHDAQEMIKTCVKAGPDGRVIACGTGATGAIHKLQQILGIALPPATAERMRGALEAEFGEEAAESAMAAWERRRPVVFVGPYEHHSNEISWRDGFAEVVRVDLAEEGSIHEGHLGQLLAHTEYRDRPKIGAFSAASNVTGVRSDVHRLARLLHRHGALACFDYAASGPYVPIDMTPPVDEAGDPSLDAIVLSPHKFLGGPGSSGVLVFNKQIYDQAQAPTAGGGGAVAYVSPWGHDYYNGIEEREAAGTPGSLQVIRAALAMQIKEEIGPERIEARENALVTRAFEDWSKDPHIEILGPRDPSRRIGIVSFNIMGPDERYLHPKFITGLLNDLFGIQSRAGCSCAGPYGHALLGIGEDFSQSYRDAIREGYDGIKPGWCRIGFHYAMDDAEADFIIWAVRFIAKNGARFLRAYRFDPQSGDWRYGREKKAAVGLSLTSVMSGDRPGYRLARGLSRSLAYGRYKRAAWLRAFRLGKWRENEGRLESQALEALRFFHLPQKTDR